LTDLLIVGKSFLVVAFSVEILFIAAVGDRVRKYPEERQLFVEAGDAFRSRIMKSSRPVVAENVSKRFRVAIEEILPPHANRPISFSHETGKAPNKSYFAYNKSKFSRISAKDNGF